MGEAGPAGWSGWALELELELAGELELFAWERGWESRALGWAALEAEAEAGELTLALRRVSAVRKGFLAFAAWERKFGRRFRRG